MPENFYEDQCSRQAKSIYKIGYKAIALMVFLCQCQYYNNINYYDLLGSILRLLFKINKMKYLNGKYYVEVKDKKYKIHPTENIILRERERTKIS